jgi:DNA-binding CsgD family transcriptional regulator
MEKVAMSNSEAIEKIQKLTDQEREVFKLFCEDLIYRDIGDKLGIEETTVKKHMSNIRIKFGIDMMNRRKRDSVLRNKFCMALQALENQDQKKDINEESQTGTELKDSNDKQTTDTEIIEDNVPEEKTQEKEKEKPREDGLEKVVKKDDKKPPLQEPQKPINEKKDGNQMKNTDERKNDRFRSLKTIWRLISIAAIIFSGYMIYDHFFGPTPTQPASSPEDPAVEQEQISTTDTEIVPTDEIQPTEVSSETEIVPTEPPTLAPTTPPKPEILFEDDFSSGLSDAWEIVSGNAIVVNGMLSADRDTWLLIGDPTWGDYSVEFQAETEIGWLSEGADIVSLRVSDIDNMYALKWTVVESEWYVVENGEWNTVPQSHLNDGKRDKNFRFEAKGDSIKFYSDGTIASSFFDSKFPQGRIGLFISTNTVIDNFKVREILE